MGGDMAGKTAQGGACTRRGNVLVVVVVVGGGCVWIVVVVVVVVPSPRPEEGDEARGQRGEGEMPRRHVAKSHYMRCVCGANKQYV